MWWPLVGDCCLPYVGAYLIRNETSLGEKNTLLVFLGSFSYNVMVMYFHNFMFCENA